MKGVAPDAGRRRPGPLSDRLLGVLALARLTVLEAMRARLWLVLAAGMAVVIISLPGLRTAEEGDRLKLAVAVVMGTAGFVVVLGAALVGAAAARRDIETRSAFMLFAKPLSRGAYLWGRWLGVQIALLACLLGLGAVGTMSIMAQLGGLPQPVSARQPQRIERIDGGQARELPATEQRLRLTGAPRLGQGEGLRAHFEGLPRDRELTLLVKSEIGGAALGTALRQARVSLAVLPADGGLPQLLELAPDSPYGGATIDGAHLESGEVILRDREARRSDLSADYLRARVPAGMVGADGRLSVQLTRTSGEASLVLDVGGAAPRSLLVAMDGGSFILNLFWACLVQLAQAGMLCACSLAVVAVARIGTVLLASLAFWFGGQAVSVITEGMEWMQWSRPAERIVELLVVLLPDLSRFPVEAQLAASQGIGLLAVVEAWAYYGIWTLLFMLLAWFGLRSVEL